MCIFAIEITPDAIMKPTDSNFQKLTGEWNKHIRKRKGLKKLYNKKRRAFLKKMFNKFEI